MYKKYLQPLLICCLALSTGSCCRFKKQQPSGQMTAAQEEIIIRSTVIESAHPIYFKFDSSKIDGESVERMNLLMAELQILRQGTLVLRGYADTGETDPTKLSLARIKAVEAMLIKGGIMSSGNITIKYAALGSKDPLASYNTVDNDPKGRRVDIFIN